LAPENHREPWGKTGEHLRDARRKGRCRPEWPSICPDNVLQEESTMTPRAHISNVNWRKLLSDLRSSYQSRNPCEVLVSELLANSLDAGANRVIIELDGSCPKTLRISDDGKGMTKRDFEDYHNLASMKKHKGSGIGWAGIGAKLYIDRARTIYTETCSDSFSGATVWSFPKADSYPTYDYVDSRRLCPKGHGTVVEVVVSEKKDCERLTEDIIEDTVLANYNYALQPNGQAVVTLNGTRIKPFVPKEVSTKSHDVNVKLRNGAIATGVFTLMDQSAPAGFSLISIVVHGKTIEEQYDFRQFSRIKNPDAISGYVQCDELIHAVTTSKDSFQKKTSEWQEFNNKIGKEFSDWLKEIGCMVSVKTDEELRNFAQKVQEDLNKIFKLPEIRELHLDLFQNLAKRLSAFPDPSGDMKALEAIGLQMVGGTIGGPGPGDLMSIEGPDFGKSIVPEPQGNIEATQKPRQSRGGIKITLGPLPDPNVRAWTDPGLQAIQVNTENPAFKCATMLNDIQFYLIDECLNVVCERIEEESERKATVNKMLSAYLKTRREGDKDEN
jgi:anti-sigma regulatory factor (Ser/Thr protein kinase)